ncbi:carboxypeptidase-like regulatory domain-containing protein [uncultured Dokdonia sp.]|uniref:carboxypeptidase-like regulatory domain-containing protein n=1 Tax=uncultured Dokdonia sp. TaxID=575653 RepID=UPI0026095A19|nr:carboxypeptidase-like regulatory domain-containing protein [uncultured Dokdonia sp.]
MFSQNEKEIIGQVLEINTLKPISFATVQIKNTKLGVIADEEGYFRLPYVYKEKKGSIIITSIGYQKREIALASLKDGVVNTIAISVQTESLGVVNLKFKKKKRLSARQIVKKAIANIPRNLPSIPHAYIGYYRDYKLLDDEYVNLNEGIVEVFDGGIQTDKIGDSLNQSVLYKYALNENFKRNKLLEKPYDNRDSKYIIDRLKYIEGARVTPLGGNELSILNLHDPIRNYNEFSFSFIDVFENDFIKNHDFRLIGKTLLNELSIYEIAFTALVDAKRKRYKISGKIFIETTNFAIHKIEYESFQSAISTNFESIQYASNSKAISNEKFKPFYSLKLQYSRIRDKMYLNYISFNNSFRLDTEEGFFVKDFLYDKIDNAFFVEFSSDVPASLLVDSRSDKLNGVSSIRKITPRYVEVNNVKNYLVKYRNISLEIKDVEILKPNLIKINLKNTDLLKLSNRNIKNHLKYEIYNLKDVYGRDINQVDVFDVYQFREFFIQEVFVDKEIPDDLEFVEKSKNLTKSKINTLDNVSRYWINTPLRKIKEKSR